MLSIFKSSFFFQFCLFIYICIGFVLPYYYGVNTLCLKIEVDYIDLKSNAI